MAVVFCFFGARLNSNGEPTAGPNPDLLVRPSQTDSAIHTFDHPHGIYFPAAHGPDRGLLIFIPGTGGNTEMSRLPAGGEWFCRIAASLGYHAIYLAYSNSTSAAAACADSADPDAYAKFRQATLEGGDTPFIKVAPSESIDNRLVKLLAYLQRQYSGQGWEEFERGGAVAWEKVALAGSSLGGGHAAYIATQHKVARVICVAAPKDFSRKLLAPAPWFDHSMTPPGRFFAFNHKQDEQGCTTAQLLVNLRRLGVISDDRGTADIDEEQPPYHHAHALFTNYPGTTIPSPVAHSSLIRGDVNPPGNPPRFASVWEYLLTEPVE